MYPLVGFFFFSFFFKNKNILKGEKKELRTDKALVNQSGKQSVQSKIIVENSTWLCKQMDSHVKFHGNANIMEN